ncbi:MAG TPA: hypothetical protein VF137_10550 [Candidatus Dormibacteraeota bacterium]
MEKKLKLNRLTLRELTPADLKVVAGGELTPDVRTLPVDQCIVLVSTAAQCVKP